LTPGTPVRIVAREGLTLMVEPSGEAREGDD
jgi:membrane protein implicated in regulation of membrane protease activity